MAERTHMATNTQNLIQACDTISHRCTMIAGTHHGSAWLFDKLMRYFDSDKAATSVTIPVFLNAPILKEGEATIGRDGSLQMRTV